MFQAFITIITLLSTGLHAVIGCSWHHEHASAHADCEPRPAVNAQEDVSIHSCCQHADQSHRHATDKNQEPRTRAVTLEGSSPCGHSHEHDSEECDEGRCQYLVNVKVEVPSLDGSNLNPGFTLQIADGGALAAELWGTSPHTLSASLLSGSLRVRDLTQITRI